MHPVHLQLSGWKQFRLFALSKCWGLQMYIITLISSSNPSISLTPPAEGHPQPHLGHTDMHMAQMYISLLMYNINFHSLSNPLQSLSSSVHSGVS